MKKDQCTIVATILVETKYPGKKKTRHGKFERGIEDMLQQCYVVYMKHLITKIPEANNFEWKQINEKTIELVATPK